MTNDEGRMTSDDCRRVGIGRPEGESGKRRESLQPVVTSFVDAAVRPSKKLKFACRLPLAAFRSLLWFRGSSIVLLLVFLAFVLGGCGTQLPYLQRLRPLPAGGNICRVAVLPFTSESDYPQSAAILTKVITAELSKLGNYVVTQEGDVDKLYLQLRILPGQAPTQEQLQILTSRLNVQLLFTGHILEMRENPTPDHSINPVLAMRLEILDGKTGALLWNIYHRRQGLDYLKVMHFGIIHSMAGLTKQVGSEIINLMFKKGLPQCDVSPPF